MAASDFVQEIHSIGERLRLKLQRLPRAEPVEIVAFSVILLFIGKSGLSGSPQHAWFSLASRRDEKAVLARGLVEVAASPPNRRGEAGVPRGKPRGFP